MKRHTKKTYGGERVAELEDGRKLESDGEKRGNTNTGEEEGKAIREKGEKKKSERRKGMRYG